MATRSAPDHTSIDTAANHLEAARDRWDDVTPVSRAGLQAVAGINSEQLMRSLRRRFELLEAIGAVFDQVDILLTPTTASKAVEPEPDIPLEQAIANAAAITPKEAPLPAAPPAARATGRGSTRRPRVTSWNSFPMPSGRGCGSR